MLKKILITGLSAFVAVNAVAGDEVYDPNLPLEWASIITVSGGPAWSSPGKSQHLFAPMLPIDEFFIANNKTTTLGTGEIYFGLQHVITPTLIGQLGIGAAAASDAQLSGVINVNGFDNVYAYQYKISHARVELKGKLIAAGWSFFQPYFSGSFGAGFNHSHDYIATKLDPLAYTPSLFDSSSNVAFSYTVGAGIQKMVTPNWQVGVGYEFADWGKNYLASDGNTDFFSQGPGYAHLYTNELLFSLSYLF